jgi:hypothetical protein
MKRSKEPKQVFIEKKSRPGERRNKEIIHKIGLGTLLNTTI